MRIIARFALSLDGFAADSDGRPAILAAPEFDHGKTSHGIPEFNAGCEAVAMGRTTFDPAATNSWWPWPDLDVHVLTSSPLPDGDFPSEIVAHSDPAELVAALRKRYAKDVLLLGGPTRSRRCSIATRSTASTSSSRRPCSPPAPRSPKTRARVAS